MWPVAQAQRFPSHWLADQFADVALLATNWETSWFDRKAVQTAECWSMSKAVCPRACCLPTKLLYLSQDNECVFDGLGVSCCSGELATHPKIYASRCSSPAPKTAHKDTDTESLQKLSRQFGPCNSPSPTQTMLLGFAMWLISLLETVHLMLLLFLF